EVSPAATKAMETVLAGDDPGSLSDSAAVFGEADWASLISIGEAVVKLREQDLAAFRRDAPAILGAFEQEQVEEERERALSAGRHPAPAGGAGNPTTSATRFSTALEWAAKGESRAIEARRFLDLLPQPYSTPRAATMSDYDHSAALRLQLARSALELAKQSAAIEPVGLLHLERLNYIPAGIEPGELVHSVPLSPGEEVNIAHKEWSNTSEEFSKLVTDFMEAYSEEGVTEKSELKESVTAQEQHSSGFNTGVTASGGYGPVSITATA